MGFTTQHPYTPSRWYRGTLVIEMLMQYTTLAIHIKIHIALVPLFKNRGGWGGAWGNWVIMHCMSADLSLWQAVAAAVCQEKISAHRVKRLRGIKTLFGTKVYRRRRLCVEDCVRWQIAVLSSNWPICALGAGAHVIIRLQLRPVFLHHAKHWLEPLKVALGVCHVGSLVPERKARSRCCHVC